MYWAKKSSLGLPLPSIEKNLNEGTLIKSGFVPGR
jgi:hypothetical protein